MSWNLLGHEWAEKLLKEQIAHCPRRPCPTCRQIDSMQHPDLTGEHAVADGFTDLP